MFLASITLTRTLPCLADPGRIIVVGRPSHSLEEVLPYLATLPNVIAYNPGAATLTLRRQPGLITLHADRVSITQVQDVAEGLQLLTALTDAVNAVWEHRAGLAAVMSPRRAPRLLDVWSLLPRTNCRQCGEQTCMAFAFGLLQQQRILVECPPLQTESALADRRAALERML
jgi:ArsR family metal-binding transcriptional regulator